MVRHHGYQILRLQYETFARQCPLQIISALFHGA
jgi:hypothetical protein